ncbi:MAG: sulfite exporter TauE/SafE family protein [Acidobacteriales bacterium]|nr:sulfite exporter TauE/SafE family protein [Terriglobales bacterium]
MFPHLAVWQWLLGAFCALAVGIAKTGVPGLGILVVPLMVLTVGDARFSAGWLLPMLCTADIFAVILWRRHAAASKLFSLAPWVAAGMILGAAALALPESILRTIVGAIVLLMMFAYLYRRRRGDERIPAHPAPFGVAAGFATTVANAAGPVMNLYLLGKRLTKEEFVATGAWFFFLINLTKLPIYAGHGLFSRTSLLFDAAMVPMIVVGAAAGRWLVNQMSPRIFEVLVIVLTFISTLLLFV